MPRTPHGRDGRATRACWTPLRAGAIALPIAVAAAGCQGAADIGAPTLSAPSPDAVPVASNELVRLGLKDIGAGNNGLAADHFLTATEQNHDDGVAWLGLAAAYDNLKRFDLADKAYAQAVRISGRTLAIANNQGYSYYLRGDRARALSEFRYALTLDPSSRTTLNNIRLVGLDEKPNKHSRP